MGNSHLFFVFLFALLVVGFFLFARLKHRQHGQSLCVREVPPPPFPPLGARDILCAFGAHPKFFAVLDKTTPLSTKSNFDSGIQTKFKRSDDVKRITRLNSRDLFWFKLFLASLWTQTI